MSALYRIHDFEVPKTLVEAEAERESRGPEDAEELPDDMREIIRRHCRTAGAGAVGGA